jgi:hypothetical protein
MGYQDDHWGRSMYYDRQGRPITLAQWCEKLEHPQYKRVLGTMLDQGGWVSTVWLGLNHEYFGGPPLIFETIWFGSDGEINEQVRYTTEAQAKAGHWDVVAVAREPARARDATKSPD